VGTDDGNAKDAGVSAFGVLGDGSVIVDRAGIGTDFREQGCKVSLWAVQVSLTGIAQGDASSKSVKHQ
jgi:hypothetical protein